MLPSEAGRLARILFHCQGTANSHLPTTPPRLKNDEILTLHECFDVGILVPCDSTLTYGVYFSYCCAC